MIWASAFCIVFGLLELVGQSATTGLESSVHGTGAVILFSLSVLATRIHSEFEKLKK